MRQIKVEQEGIVRCGSVSASVAHCSIRDIFLSGGGELKQDGIDDFLKQIGNERDLTCTSVTW